MSAIGAARVKARLAIAYRAARARRLCALPTATFGAAPDTKTKALCLQGFLL